MNGINDIRDERIKGSEAEALKQNFPSYLREKMKNLKAHYSERSSIEALHQLSNYDQSDHQQEFPHSTHYKSLY
jgi:hypothetical protein